MFFCFLFHAEDVILDAHYGLEFRRVLFLSSRSSLSGISVQPSRASPMSTVTRAGPAALASSRPAAVSMVMASRPSSPMTSAATQRVPLPQAPTRSEEHTSELQSLMRISYAVFCLINNRYKYKTLLQPSHYSHTQNTSTNKQQHI